MCQVDPHPSMRIYVLKKIHYLPCGGSNNSNSSNDNHNRKVACVIPVLKCFWCNILLNLSKFLDFIYFKDRLERGVLYFASV